jgi:predicted component of type VI protein secretion system
MSHPPAHLDALLTPADGPVAADDRYRDLRGELDRLASPSGADVDWRKIAAAGAALTREVGKDLGVVAYTAFARLKLRDASAAVPVLALARLLHAPPAGLTPTRPRPRAAALAWLIARVAGELPALGPADAALLRALAAAVHELAAAARAALGDECPAFSGLSRALDAACATLPPEPTGDRAVATGSLAAPTSSVSIDPTAAASPPIAAAATPLAASPPAGPSPNGPAAATPLAASPPAGPSPAEAAPAWRAALAPYLVPLSADAPCGGDPAGTEPFDDARMELNKLGALTPEPVDWARVEAHCDGLLRTLTRDLRVAAWFALARVHRARLAGLVDGLHLFAALLEAHADIHPRKPKPRRELADWFVKQVAAALAAAPPADRALLAALDLAHAHLAAALPARLGADAPSLRPLREALQRAAELAPVPKDSPRAADGPAVATGTPVTDVADRRADERPLVDDRRVPVADDHRPVADNLRPVADNRQVTVADNLRPVADNLRPVADNRQVTVADNLRPPVPGDPRTPVADAPRTSGLEVSRTPPAPLGDLPDAPTPPADLARLDGFLDRTGDALIDVARALRESAPADPRGYRLLRVGLWLGVAAPAPRQDGTTAVPGLPDRDRDQIAELAAHARWPGLLARCENLLVRHRLALDLQRHAAAALAGLGHADAALAVRAELRALLTRLPQLVDLRDRDGQPLADPATRRWICDDLLPRPGAAAPADPDDPTFWSGLPARLAGPDRPAALADAQARIDTCPSGQLRFTRRLALADACERAGLAPLAALLHAGLTAELERTDLERWDPALAARSLAAAARCHQARGAVADAHAALTRLARLDPAATQ